MVLLFLKVAGVRLQARLSVLEAVLLNGLPLLFYFNFFINVNTSSAPVCALEHLPCTAQVAAAKSKILAASCMRGRLRQCKFWLLHVKGKAKAADFLLHQNEKNHPVGWF